MYSKPSSLPKKNLPRPFVKGHDAWSEVSEFSWKCAFDHIHFREGIPGPWYIDNAANPRGMWVWDQCFMALYSRYLPDIFPGVQSLDNLYGWQREDGYISMSYDFSGKERYGERVNPPLYAWAEWEYYVTTGRGDRIERALPSLIKNYEWLFDNRKCEDFDLWWFEDAGSSGMDNSPRGRRDPSAGKQMGWVDLSSQLAMLALYISRLAGAIGRQGVADRFIAEWRYVANSVERWCWCPRSAFYHDRLDRSNWLASKTAAGFWPMAAEFASSDHVEALCKHLENPATFGRPWLVPTLSYDDANYEDRGDYWLGGVWPPTNYMIAWGLRKYGKHALARKVACSFVEQMAKVYREYEQAGTIWEAYAPESAEPCTVGRIEPFKTRLVRPDFAGWSAIGTTAMFYEFVLGLDSNVPDNTLTWNIGLKEEHGVENFPFGKARVDFKCGARKSLKDKATVTVSSTGNMSLLVVRGSATKKVALKKGRKARVVV